MDRRQAWWYGEGMNSDLFWQVFAAILGANLLTVGFVWAMMHYSRLERDGHTHEAKFPIYCGMFLPLFFLAGGLYVAFGGQ